MDKRTVRLGLLAAALSLSAGLAAIARGDDRASAAAILDLLDRDAAHKTLTAEPVKQARAALERATRMRSTGDDPHARIADGLALEWAETARDLVRTADVEQKAAGARVDAIDAGARADRERALLEEGIARTGRLRAETEAVEHEKKEAPARTSPLGASVDGGAPRRAPRADGGTR